MIDYRDMSKCSKIKNDGEACGKPAVTWYTTHGAMQSRYFIVHARCADCTVGINIKERWIQLSKEEIEAYYLMTR